MSAPSTPISHSSRFWPSDRSLARKSSLSTPMRCVTVRLNRRTCATISADMSLTLVRGFGLVGRFRGAIRIDQQLLLARWPPGDFDDQQRQVHAGGHGVACRTGDGVPY